jgi:hypothetical protein
MLLVNDPPISIQIIEQRLFMKMLYVIVTIIYHLMLILQCKLCDPCLT